MYIKKLTIWLLMLLALGSCSDVKDALGIDDTPEVPSSGVVLTLKLPNFTRQDISTRAASEPISTIAVACYDGDGNYLGITNVANSDITDKGNDTYDARVRVVPGTSVVHIVTNTTLTDADAADSDGKINLYKARRSGNIDMSAPICWGSATVDELLSGNAKVSLIRLFAKASVAKDDKLGNFEITGFKLYNTASAGTLATPSLSDVADATVDCTARTTDFVTGEQAFYETPAGKSFMVIRAKYNGGAETYYKVQFQSSSATSNDNQMPLLRNHHYKVIVTAANHEGWSSEQLAVDNPAENRIRVEVVDDNPPIVDMIACKDYELGVCATQTVLGKALSAKVTIVTTKPDFDFDITSNQDWLTVNKTPAETIVLPTDADGSHLSSTGRQYTINLTLKENFNSEPRTATLLVTSGDLSREIKVTQLGYDFRTDANRRVEIRGLDGLTADEQNDYFKWMDSSLKGIQASENQGLTRNDGLHFFVGNNPVYYLIPKLSGDKLSCNDSRVKVDENSVSGYYKVTLADNSADSYNNNNYNLWVSNEAFTIITITNANNEITITYPVYHIGVFSRITGSVASDYQLGTDKKSGWYYYEMVDVKGASKTYHILDRNVGASTDAYFTRATTALEADSVAIGGYFKISNADPNTVKTDNTVADALSIGAFKVCTNDMLEDLINCGRLSVVSKKTDYGESYNCVQIETTGNSQHKYIYIPMSGIYESQSYKDAYHANLWTRTRLSDYQGFSASSPEYGFWYIYLDVYGKQVNLSNNRVVSGSSGENTGRYRAMPVRLAIEL